MFIKIKQYNVDFDQNGGLKSWDMGYLYVNPDHVKCIRHHVMDGVPSQDYMVICLDDNKLRYIVRTSDVENAEKVILEP